jgi:predicted phage-related endonuclease
VFFRESIFIPKTVIKPKEIASRGELVKFFIYKKTKLRRIVDIFSSSSFFMGKTEKEKTMDHLGINFIDDTTLQERQVLEMNWLMQFDPNTEIKAVEGIDPLDVDAWLLARQNGLGASDTSHLFGVGYAPSLKRLWNSKVKPYQPPGIKGWERSECDPVPGQISEAAWMGHLMEPCIARLFEFHTGKKVFQPSQYYKGIGPFQVSPDRIVENEFAFLEIKNQSEYRREDWEYGGVPKEYNVQCQCQMSCAPGMQYMYIAALLGGNSFVFRKIERDDALIEEIGRRGQDFWDTYVVPKVEPPITYVGDLDDVQYVKPQNSKVIELDSQLNNLAQQYLDAKAETKKADEQVEIAKAQLMESLGDAESAINDDFIITAKERKPRASVNESLLKEEEPGLYKQFCVESFDAKKMRESDPTNYLLFTTEKPYRVLNVKQNK